MKFFKLFTMVLAIIYSINNICCDLPVHCLSKQVEGNWLFHMSSNKNNKFISCGHDTPDKNLDHIDSEYSNFKEEYQIAINLDRPNHVSSLSKKPKSLGRWTMIYDEGFEVRINEYSFFAFSKYRKVFGEPTNNDTTDTPDYVNVCNKTFLGWFHDRNNNHWGCYWAEKVKTTLSEFDYSNIFSENNRIDSLKKNKNDSGNNQVSKNKLKQNKNASSNVNAIQEDEVFGLLNKLTNSVNNESEGSLDLSIISNFNGSSMNIDIDPKVNGPIDIKDEISNDKSKKVEDSDITSVKNGPIEKAEVNTNTSKNKLKSNLKFNPHMVTGPHPQTSQIKEDSSTGDDLLTSLFKKGKSTEETTESSESDDRESNIPHLDIYYLNKKIKGKRKPNFLEVSEKEKFFVPDINFVNKINDPRNKSLWKATVYKDFIGKSYSQMSSLLGNQKGMILNKNIEDFENEGDDANSFLEVNLEVQTRSKSYEEFFSKEEAKEEEKYEGLPRHFDWRDKDGQNFDSPIKTQGECGSCYAIASASIIEARVRIQTNNKDKPILSASSLIGCSRYNQGCSGGYPYLIGKFATEFGLVEESCQPYSDLDNICRKECFDKKKYMVKEYGYVGGFYGGCSEIGMMKEVISNGPIVVAINASPELYYYKTGIFKSNLKKTEGKFEKGVKPWEYTNHAVVCIGWGEEYVEGERIKYWIIKNSWGENWGENGYFKLVRGEDMASVEAQGVFINPSLD